MSYLLDTNVLSELRKPAARRNAGLAAWFSQARPEGLYLSVLVLGEVRKGIERLRAADAAQAFALDTWLGQIQAHYADRIVPITGAIAERWGRAQSTRNFPVIDALMAATADEHGLQLVSRNVGDLAGWPSVHPPINPFSA